MVRRRRRRSTFSPARWLIVCLAIVVIGLGLATWYLLRVRGVYLEEDQVELGTRIAELAVRRGAAETDIRADDPIRKINGVFFRSWYLTLPSHEAAAALVGDIENEIKNRGLTLAVVEPDQADLVRFNLDLGIEVFDLHLRVATRKAAQAAATPRPRPTATPRPSPAPGQRGRLAILIDDAGQQLDLIAVASALPEAVAVSVLPFLPSSAAAAGQMHRSGHEVWLHLPMEPAEYPARNPGPGAVLVSMSEEEVRTTVHVALNNVPFVVGVNNHMGSRATADLRTMTWVMQEISARDLSFIDSRTIVDTVAEDAARSQGVPTGRRHIFLDNHRNRAAISNQLAEAIYRARTEGEIIAIGHMVEVTIQTLRDELPSISDRGIDLVPPSTLMR